MYWLLTKLIVCNFYRVNAGFFLFFLFVFFGAVQGGSLMSYHLSLMNSILISKLTLLLVLTLWTFYHLKCLSFFFTLFNNEEANFLSIFQSLSPRLQWGLSLLLYAAIYAPVLVYSVLLCIIGYRLGYSTTSSLVVLFQMVSIAGFSSLVYLRLHNWTKKLSVSFPSFQFSKHYLLFHLFFLTIVKRKLFLLLKTFSLVLLSVVFVWNKGKYNRDSFLLFYLVLMMAHVTIPYLSVRFNEKELVFMRSMPLSLVKRAACFVVMYFIVLLPEFLFLLYNAIAFPVEHRVAYYLNAVAGLCFLTAVQYSSAFNKNEYLKVSFGLLFFSIFALHAQAFWFWIGIQFTIAVLLFGDGYYRYQPEHELPSD